MGEGRLLEKTLPGLHEHLVSTLYNFSHDTPILDLGCGTGAWLERLAISGFNCLTGVDENAAQFRAPHATFNRVDLNLGDWELGGATFGLITAIELIEHLENPGNFFRNASMHLRSNGYILITTPNIHSVGCRLKFLLTGNLKSFDNKGDPTHIYPLLLTTLDRVLPRYAMKVVKRWGYPPSGSLISRRSTQLVVHFLEMFLPNPAPGDTLCLLMQKT